MAIYHLRRWALLCLALTYGIVGTVGAETPADSVRLLSDTGEWDHLTMEVRFDRPSVGIDGSYAVIDLPGFDRGQASGFPDLPYRTYRVAVPHGAELSLEVQPGRVRSLGTLRPRPVPYWDRVEEIPADRIPEQPPKRLERRARYEEEPAGYAPGRPSPIWAWLGERGEFRDQAYVVVHVAPVRYRAAAGQVDWVDQLTLNLRFDGVVPRTRQPTDAATGFEALYRNMFVNYAQGIPFRRPQQGVASQAKAPRPAFGAETTSGGDIGPAPGPADAARGGVGPRYRITVRERGLFSIDFASLNAAGFAAAPISTWRLSHLGTSIGFVVDGDGDDSFESGETLLFYGRAYDYEARTRLHRSFQLDPQSIYEMNDFTDENVYFLTVEVSAQAGIASTDATPTNTRIPPTDFESVARAEVDEWFLPNDDADPWYWSPTLSTTGTALREDSLALPGVLPFASAQVRVGLQGRSGEAAVDPDHTTQVSLLGQGGAVLQTDQLNFDDFTYVTHDFGWTWPGSGAGLDGNTTVRMEVLPVAGVTRNDAILDFIEVAYRRSFDAVNDQLLVRWPDADAEFIVDGFSDSNIRVFEVTQAADMPAKPTLLTGGSVSGAGPYSIRFRVDQDGSGDDREFLVVSSAGATMLAGADFEADAVSDLRNTAKQADYIVLGLPSTLDVAPGSVADQWIAYRESPAGGNLNVEVVWLEDVVDEFADGLWGPDAITEFFRFVMSTEPGEGWASPKPRFALLVGDASFNYKDREAAGNYLPSRTLLWFQPELGYYVSDTLMAAVVGNDLMPDLMLGRIPSRNATQTANVLQKILDYPSQPSGSWQSHHLFVSDRAKFTPIEDEEFEGFNDDSAARRTGNYTDVHVRYQDVFDSFAGDRDLASADANLTVVRSVNGADGIANGTSIVQYVGHGAHEVWSDDAIWDERAGSPNSGAEALFNPRYPWLLAHNCLTGAFNWCPGFCDTGTVSRNLAERWLFRVDAGAVGALAPTGLSLNLISGEFTRPMWDTLYGTEQRRAIGDLHMAGIAGLCTQATAPAFTQGCEFYTVLGDPAAGVRVPTVGPASGVQAVGANMSVQLTWNESSSGAGTVYDVYRQEQTVSQQPYVKVNGAPLEDPSFLDAGLTNAVDYRYTVVALDPVGLFASRWSNFNTGCDSGGADCVEATPLNPNPPGVPQGLAVSDPGFGDTLRVEWLSNPEVDLAPQAYTVLWGTQPGVYTESAPASSSSNTILISGLTEGETVFVSITATNTSGLTSAEASPVSDFPVFAPQGLRPPRSVTALNLDKNGNSVDLSWEAVTTDIYGKPIPEVSYELLKGQTGLFVNADLTQTIHSCTGCTAFTDTDALLAVDDLHYRVRVIGADGLPSSLGDEYPDGTTLRLNESSTPGLIRLEWDPVAATISGTASGPVSYEIYSRDSPFTRIDIEDGAAGIVLEGTSADPFLEIPDPAGDRYYSVIVVDAGGNRSPF